ncbi:MAG: phosphotransferase family protein [Candidatus Binataceae bacterium]
MPEPSQEPIPEYGDVRPEEQLDWKRLADYLRGKIPGADAPMTVKQFRGGHSNLTYLLRFGGQEWVMRRPPFGPLPVGGHDMGREYRVLSRLWEVFKPAPRAMLYTEDESIVGAKFLIMERRTGIVVSNRQPLPKELGDDPATFRAISEGFIDTLADLHAVDYRAIGLGELGRPEGYMKRQIVGWMGRWEKAKTREVPLMERLGEWFLQNIPEPPPATLIHNDFYLHNLMLGAKNHGEIAGVFDWEMATLGDPLVDVGTALGYWREKGDPEELMSKAQPISQAHTTRPGFMTRDELLHRYSKRTGRDISRIAFYWAWANWKNATVIEQIYARFARGQTSDPRFAAMSEAAPGLASAAAQIAGKLGFKS